nr:hypothetical protein [Dendronalium phyllosphericum]
MSGEVAKAHDQGRRVLIITHRIQLGEALCDRFGVDYVSEIHTSDTGGLLGYGVCVDSLHKDSRLSGYIPDNFCIYTIVERHILQL